MNISNFHADMLRAVLGLSLLACSAIASAAPQIPDFVYQGRLEQNGIPADGTFDLSFTLFDAASGGNQVGSTINQANYPVTDGLFSVSLAFPGAFVGEQLYLQVSVEGTPMLPRQAVATAPVSQFTLSGSVSGPAGGDLTGNYPNPSIAFGAVTNSEIAPIAVSNSKIADNAISSSKIAPSAVDADAIASGAVGTSEIANDSVTRGKIAGGYSNGSITFTVGANDCNTYNIEVPGAQINDMVIFNLRSNSSLPSNLMVQPVRVSAADTVEIRACNNGNTSQSTGDIAVFVLTLR